MTKEELMELDHDCEFENVGHDPKSLHPFLVKCSIIIIDNYEGEEFNYTGAIGSKKIYPIKKKVVKACSTGKTVEEAQSNAYNEALKYL